jgi:hypothetical protein
MQMTGIGHRLSRERNIPLAGARHNTGRVNAIYKVERRLHLAVSTMGEVATA